MSFCGIYNLPEEIIEKILALLSPYCDLTTARLVSKQWNRLITGIIHRTLTIFHQSLKTCSLRWEQHQLVTSGPTVAERYSHCSCYHNKSLYVFGGCTSTNTTFNDLWRFDLTTAEWVRPLAMGVYPSPKACASLVCHRDTLVLFGGWSHPSPYPLHQAAKFFSELHIYTPASNRWSYIETTYGPPPTAGHSASTVGDCMVVFGGCQSPGVGSNYVWLFDLVLLEWRLQETSTHAPQPRYGQSQSVLNGHLLVIGGCGGPNQIFNDLWSLEMTGDVWQWTEVTINNPELGPPQLWCHQACKVGNAIVVLSKPSKAMRAQLEQERTALEAINQKHEQVHSRVTRNRVSLKYQQQDRDSRDFRGCGKPRQNLDDSGVGGSLASSDGDEGNVDTSMDVAVGSANVEEGEVKALKDTDVCSGDDSVFVAESDSLLSGSTRCCPEMSTAERVSVRGLAGRSPCVHCKTSQSKWESFSRDVVCDSTCNKCNRVSPRQESLNVTSNHESDSHTNTSPSNRGSDAAQKDRSAKSSQPSIRPNASRNRQKQLEMLQHYSERIRQLSTSRTASPRSPTSSAAKSSPPTRKSYRDGQAEATSSRDIQSLLCLHVLDAERAITHGHATWSPLNYSRLRHSMEETIFYTLTEGRGELFLFGGMHRDLTPMLRSFDVQSDSITNALYRIKSAESPFQ